MAKDKVASPAKKSTDSKLRKEDEMALEGSPVPIKIAPDTLAILRSESVLTGKHINEIARGIIKAWADQQVHISNVRHQHLRSAGFNGVDGFISESQE
jgi:hypothetical protein